MDGIPSEAPPSYIDSIYPLYLQALLSGDRTGCLALVQGLLQRNLSLKSIYIDLFQKSLYQVGELWERNRISVATEHMATAITESAMGLLHPLIFGRERVGRRAIVACVADEYHQIGGKMVADIFEIHGWDGYFLGANTPERDLLQMVREKRPDLLCLSLSLYSNLPGLLRVLSSVRREFNLLEILVGGQAFRWGGVGSLAHFSRLHYVDSLDSLEKLLLRGGKP